MRHFRHVSQFGFLALTLIVVYGLRKNAEMWCPFGGLECLSLYIQDGKMLCALGSSNFFILAAIVLLTLFFRRVFCGYMCPLGAIAEGMRWLSSKMGIKQWQASARVDKVMSLMKYAILVFLLFGTWQATELIFRHADPCFALLGYSTNEEVAWTAFATLGLFFVSALFISMPFCRWFCPFGAALNILSRIAPAKIKRDTSTCIDCGKCSRACPMAIDVAKCETVTEARCMACQECVDVCPVKDKTVLTWQWGGRRIVPVNQVIAAAIVLCIGLAVTASYALPFPTFIHSRDIVEPTDVATCELMVEGVTCSGSARQLVFFLEREDISAVSGYIKVLTSPGEGKVSVRIVHDPTQTDRNALIEAITEPYFDADENRWRPSPFEVEGYDLFEGLD